MEISCLEVIRELSNYIDRDVPQELCARMEGHLATCAHCTAILEGLRNTIIIIGDGRSFQLPTGFSQRLRDKLIQKPHS